MERIKQKLRKLEARVDMYSMPNQVVFYDADIEGDGDRRFAEFLEEHPEFRNNGYAVFLLPKKDDETLAHHYAAMPEVDR